MDGCLGGEASLRVAAEDVQGGSGEEVVFRVEVDVGGANAGVRDGAVLRGLEVGGWVDGDGEFEIHGEGEADYVEAGAWEL